MNPRHKPASRRVGRPGGDGDLREAIVSAALRQLEECGTPGRVTVSAIVTEAGCTPPSLYHYWPTREHLLQEASEKGWALFRASQAMAIPGGRQVDDPEEPVERLRVRGRAYLDFALARPALFRVLFLEPPAQAPTSPATSAMDSPAGTPGTGKALDELVRDVVAAMAAGRLQPGDALITALALWSAMHGVASLWAVTPTLPADLAHAVGNLAQDAVLRGLTPTPGSRPDV